MCGDISFIFQPFDEYRNSREEHLGDARLKGLMDLCYQAFGFLLRILTRRLAYPVTEILKRQVRHNGSGIRGGPANDPHVLKSVAAHEQR